MGLLSAGRTPSFRRLKGIRTQYGRGPERFSVCCWRSAYDTHNPEAGLLETVPMRRLITLEPDLGCRDRLHRSGLRPGSRQGAEGRAAAGVQDGRRRGEKPNALRLYGWAWSPSLPRRILKWATTTRAQRSCSSPIDCRRRETRNRLGLYRCGSHLTRLHPFTESS